MSTGAVPRARWRPEAARGRSPRAPSASAITSTNGETIRPALDGASLLGSMRRGRRVAARRGRQHRADVSSGPPDLPWLELVAHHRLERQEHGHGDAGTKLNACGDHLDWQGTWRLRARQGALMDIAAVMAGSMPRCCSCLDASSPAREHRQLNADAATVLNAPRIMPRPLRKHGRLWPRPNRAYSKATACRCSTDRRWSMSMARAGRCIADGRGTIHLAAPDARRRAARPRPPQRAKRAGRAGAGHARRLPARADAARPARVRRRAAPRASSSACVGDVDAFDDSKGTNVGATVAALTGWRDGAAGGADPRR